MDRQLRKDVNFTTNILSFDRAIRLFASEKIRKFPKINSLTKQFFQSFSKSGLPAYIYMKSEKRLVSKIEEVMSLMV
jgi:hypothetical protein